MSLLTTLFDIGDKTPKIPRYKCEKCGYESNGVGVKVQLDDAPEVNGDYCFKCYAMSIKKTLGTLKRIN